jgi:indole-3-glycerol phosphate synthase
MTTTAAGDLLATIVAATRYTVAVRERARPEHAISPLRQPNGRAFADALRTAPAPRVIAECKRRSPSKGVLRAAYNPAAHAAAYARGGAAAISVLTEPTFFDGGLEHLRAVRRAVDLPILRKDFIVTEYQLLEAVEAGADAVLLIVAALDDGALRQLLASAGALGLGVLVEIHDERELRRALDAGATIVGVNSRNLRTLSVDRSVLEELAASLPAAVTAVAESGIRTPADLRRLADVGYHAFLVGERLITQPDPGAALAELRGDRDGNGAGGEAPAQWREPGGVQASPPSRR